MSGYVRDKIAGRSTPPAEVEPYGPPYPSGRRTVDVIEDPEWAASRWPHREDRHALGKIDFWWRRAVYPVRQLARMILWSTVSIWRTGAVIFTLWMIWQVIHTR
jgi:hypothetical protein